MFLPPQIYTECIKEEMNEVIITNSYLLCKSIISFRAFHSFLE